MPLHQLSLRHFLDSKKPSDDVPTPPPVKPRMVLNLGPDMLLAEQVWGGYIAVPASNIDVAVGIVREGIHEAWTTRLVQEMLRAGDTYINVGANFGYYTALGGLLVGTSGTVIAIEANPHVIPFTMKTIYWSSISDRVELYNIAISDVDDSMANFAFDYQFMGGGSLDFEGRAVPTGSSPYWDETNVDYLVDSERRWVKSKGLFNTYSVHCRTLDTALKEISSAHLLHMDIEGSEPAAIAGGTSLISRSPNLKVITEWSGQYYQSGDSRRRNTIEFMWKFMTTEGGFRVRHVEPRLAADGGLCVGAPLGFEAFVQMPHGDYVWIKSDQDPWK